MKTLWCKNQENPSDRISHTWAPLKRKIKLKFSLAVLKTLPDAKHFSKSRMKFLFRLLWNTAMNKHLFIFYFLRRIFMVGFSSKFLGSKVA
jgi:hypothetical protein